MLIASKYIHWYLLFQAFINTAKEIYQKIQDGVFDVTNEVCFTAVNMVQVLRAVQ